ncbi:MAG: aconitate hydratase, partial [Desulfobulbaceae bacterium]|nr:aconitate hydratase [Desulfobulbaceae bacterium]
LRSNIPAISEFVFNSIDLEFVQRAKMAGSGMVVGGENYGQGSSREHAALAPRYLEVRVKLVKSFARIHKANLINFGILPFTFTSPEDYDMIEQGAKVVIPDLRKGLESGAEVFVLNVAGNKFNISLDVSERHREILLAGGLLNWAR